MNLRPDSEQDPIGLERILCSPMAVMVILLSAFGAIGIAMQLTISASVPLQKFDYSTLKNSFAFLGINAASLFIACVVAVIFVRRHNRDRRVRAARIRAIVLSICAFIFSSAGEGWLLWAFPESSWMSAGFKVMTVVSFISFCKAIHSALLPP